MGYAYATRYKARAGYKYTLEDSVYVKSAYVRQGIGRELLRGLIVEAENRGFWQMMAAIGDTGDTTGSIELHTALGFERIGVARGIGFKFGKLVDVVYMQRKLDGKVGSVR